MATDYPWYPLYLDDFEEGTAEMSLEEVGAYVLLMNHQWRRGSVPADPRGIGRVIGVSSPKRVAALWLKLGLKFQPLDGDPSRLLNLRLAQEKAHTQARSEARSQAGRKAAGRKQDGGNSNGGAGLDVQHEGSTAQAIADLEPIENGNKPPVTDRQLPDTLHSNTGTYGDFDYLAGAHNGEPGEGATPTHDKPSAPALVEATLRRAMEEAWLEATEGKPITGNSETRKEAARQLRQAASARGAEPIAFMRRVFAAFPQLKAFFEAAKSRGEYKPPIPGLVLEALVGVGSYQRAYLPDVLDWIDGKKPTLGQPEVRPGTRPEHPPETRRHPTVAETDANPAIAEMAKALAARKALPR